MEVSNGNNNSVFTSSPGSTLDVITRPTDSILHGRKTMIEMKYEVK